MDFATWLKENKAMIRQEHDRHVNECFDLGTKPLNFDEYNKAILESFIEIEKEKRQQQ